MMKKRWISFLLAVCMLTALLPAGAVPAFADFWDENHYQTSDGYFYYTLDDMGDATIIACCETEEQMKKTNYVVTVPENITGEDRKEHPVTALRSYAFSILNDSNYDTDNCNKIKKVEIKANLTSIGDNAFSECAELTTVNLPNTITEIGEYVFSNCYKLDNVVLPSSLTEIPLAAFSGCNYLTHITIPKSIQKIGECAFEICYEYSEETVDDPVLKVTYKGTEEEWNDLLTNHLKDKWEGNKALRKAKVTYAPDPEPKPDPKPEPAPEEPVVEESAPDVLGAVGMVATAGVGAAAIGYAGYQVGTELYLIKLLPEGAAIPENAGELALLVWNNAGKPAPAALLPADASETQQAMTWAVEQDLLSADEKPEDAVSRTTVIRTWKKAQKLAD